MSYGTPDVYYQPEAFKLEEIAQHDFSDGCYQFDLRVIWRHTETGVLYTGRDCGCSCPSPFEDVTSLESLDVFNADNLINEAKNEGASEYYHGSSVVDWINILRGLS